MLDNIRYVSRGAWLSGGEVCNGEQECGEDTGAVFASYQYGELIVQAGLETSPLMETDRSIYIPVQ